MHRHKLLLLILVFGAHAVQCRLVAAQDEFDTSEPEAAVYDARMAALYQPGFQTPADAVAPEPRQRSSRSSYRTSYVRLARAPSMMGDSLASGELLTFQRTSGDVVTDLPMAGGRFLKVAENNKPIPTDRVFFVYNGFQNAITFAPTSLFGVQTVRESNFNRYTFGFEKTFLDGTCSVDVRMPINEEFGASAPGFLIDSGKVGNLVMFLKHMPYQDETLALAYGLGFGFPTGSNVEGRIDGTIFTLQNEATHLLPYVGFYSTPNENWFLQGFLDLDFAANGNDLTLGPPGTRIGDYTEQNLFHADLSLGRWLHRNDFNRYNRGLAGIVELHYTTTIQDADTITFSTADFTTSGTTIGTLTNAENRIDLLNLTAGLHWEVTQLSNLRVSCVVPLRADPDRQFDSEIQVSFNRHF